MKTIIAGSRDVYPSEIEEIFKCIDEYHAQYPITEVVCGKASGVDTIGELWANNNKIPVKAFPVSKEDWESRGRKAGIERNQTMADYADRAIIFWDGESSGTENMIDEMDKRDKPLTIWRLSSIVVPTKENTDG